jgi:hypothetical protein
MTDKEKVDIITKVFERVVPSMEPALKAQLDLWIGQHVHEIVERHLSHKLMEDAIWRVVNKGQERLERKINELVKAAE